MKGWIVAAALIAALGVGVSAVHAHNGGLAADSCHNDRKAGERHCHPDGDRKVTLTEAEFAQAQAFAALEAENAELQAEADTLRAEIELALCQVREYAAALAVERAAFWDEDTVWREHREGARRAGCDTRGW